MTGPTECRSEKRRRMERKTESELLRKIFSLYGNMKEGEERGEGERRQSTYRWRGAHIKET